MPTVFIIMPFADEFGAIYHQLLRPTLAAVGYEVVRADDITNQQSILKDIVLAINDSDLIVADMTGLNPNVFYELGLAHGLGKKVLLLTQDIASLPFDLKGYRVLGYSTHFAEVAEFKQQLTDTARGALQGTLSFGNPVSDYLGIPVVTSSHEIAINVPQPNVIPTAESTCEDASLPSGDEPGILDHLADLEESLDNLVPLLIGISSTTQEIGDYFTTQTHAMEEINRSNTPGRLQRAWLLEQTVGRKLNSYSDLFRQQNDDYEIIWHRIDNSLEAIITSTSITDTDAQPQLRSLLLSLCGVRNIISPAKRGMAVFRDSIAGVRGVEAQLRLAASEVTMQFDRLIDNFDTTDASAARMIQVGKERLGLGDDFDQECAGT